MGECAIVVHRVTVTLSRADTKSCSLTQAQSIVVRHPYHPPPLPLPQPFASQTVASPSSLSAPPQPSRSTHPARRHHAIAPNLPASGNLSSIEGRSSPCSVTVLDSRYQHVVSPERGPGEQPEWPQRKHGRNSGLPLTAYAATGRVGRHTCFAGHR